MKTVREIVTGRTSVRWFDSTKLVSGWERSLIEDAIYASPTRNGLKPFRVVRFADAPVLRRFKRQLMSLPTTRFNQPDGQIQFNVQLTSPLLYVFGQTEDIPNAPLQAPRDLCISVIMAMMQAESLGLRTCFCDCVPDIIDPADMDEEMADLVEVWNSIGPGKMTMCIGHMSHDSAHMQMAVPLEVTFKGEVLRGFALGNHEENSIGLRRQFWPSRETMIQIAPGSEMMETQSADIQP